MQPLALGTRLDEYHAYVLGSHDFRIGADLLDTAGAPVAGITDVLLDGQVNIQREGPVRRTASLTLLDPDHRLGLDPDSPVGATLYLDRMVQIRHTVQVPGLGPVTATPFVGPITTVSRDGDTIAVECQDKMSFAARGRVPLTLKKGMNAVSAIRAIFAATGEDRFRLPTSTRRLAKAYSVGWSDDASPYVVASTIARAALGMQLLYSCDGYLMLRPLPSTAAIRVDGRHLTEPIKAGYDASAVVNYVRVTGALKPKKKPKSGKDDKKKKPKVKVEKVAVSAQLPAANALSPARLGRRGAARYLPVIDDGAEYKNQAAAAARAKSLLTDKAVSSLSWAMLPLHHLDADDVIEVATDSTVVRLRLAEASIPLGVDGDMTVGAQARVSAGRRV